MAERFFLNAEQAALFKLWMREMPRIIAKVDGMRGAGVYNDRNSINIRPPTTGGGGRANQPAPDDLVIVKITGDEDAGGTYIARSCTGVIAIDPSSGNFTMPEGMTVNATNDRIVVNLDEDGLPTHWIKADSFAIGRMTGATALSSVTGNYHPVVEIIRGDYKTASPTATNAANTTTDTANTVYDRNASSSASRTYRQRIRWDATNYKFIAVEWYEDYDASGRRFYVSASSERDLVETCE